MCRRMDSRSGSGLNRVPVNKSADILGHWMHAPKPRGYAATHLVLHSDGGKRTQVKYPEWPRAAGLTKRWMLAVPVCLALEDARRLNDFGVIERAANKLDSNGQAVLSKAARHADRRESANIADAADGIGKGQRLIQIGVELAGGHWQ